MAARGAGASGAGAGSGSATTGSSADAAAAAVPPELLVSGILKWGLMLKQGGVVKSWKERFWVLFRDRLMYFEPTPGVGSGSAAAAAATSPTAAAAGAASPTVTTPTPASSSTSAALSGVTTLPAAAMARPRGVIMLADVRAVAPLRSRGAFQISLGSGASAGGSPAREYLVVASSDSERKAWMEAIQKAMFAPSQVAQLMQSAAELQRSGQLCSREVACIRAWLVSTNEADLEHAADMLRRAAATPAAGRVCDALESKLIDFTLADTEGDLMRTLQDMKYMCQEEATTASFRDRLVDAAMAQFADSTERMAAEMEERARAADGAGAASTADAPMLSLYGGARHGVRN